MYFSSLGRIVVPNDFLLRRYLFDMKLTGEKNIPVREHPHVVDFAATPGGISPHDLAVIDKEDRVVPFARVEHRVLSETAARPCRDAGGLRPIARSGTGFRWANGRNAGRAELIE